MILLWRSTESALNGLSHELAVGELSKTTADALGYISPLTLSSGIRRSGYGISPRSSGPSGLIARGSPPHPAQAQTAIIIMVDALPARIAIDPAFYPFVEQLAQNNTYGTNLGWLFSLSVPGLYSMFTGSYPTALSAIRNWNSPQVEIPNHFSMLKDNGKKIAMVGGYSTLKLYDEQADYSERIDTRNHGDVFGADAKIYERGKELITSGEYDVVYLHFNGVDHGGHLEGLDSDLYLEKSLVLDGMIEDLYAMRSPDALFSVMSDHGMTDDGHHGGGDEDALAGYYLIVPPVQQDENGFRISDSVPANNQRVYEIEINGSHVQLDLELNFDAGTSGTNQLDMMLEAPGGGTWTASTGGTSEELHLNKTELMVGGTGDWTVTLDWVFGENNVPFDLDQLLTFDLPSNMTSGRFDLSQPQVGQLLNLEMGLPLLPYGEVRIPVEVMQISIEKKYQIVEQNILQIHKFLFELANGSSTADPDLEGWDEIQLSASQGNFREAIDASVPYIDGQLEFLEHQFRRNPTFGFGWILSTSVLALFFVLGVLNIHHEGRPFTADPFWRRMVRNGPLEKYHPASFALGVIILGALLQVILTASMIPVFVVLMGVLLLFGSNLNLTNVKAATNVPWHGKIVLGLAVLVALLLPFYYPTFLPEAHYWDIGRVTFLSSLIPIFIILGAIALYNYRKKVIAIVDENPLPYLLLTAVIIAGTYRTIQVGILFHLAWVVLAWIGVHKLRGNLPLSSIPHFGMSVCFLVLGISATFPVAKIWDLGNIFSLILITLMLPLFHLRQAQLAPRDEHRWWLPHAIIALGAAMALLFQYRITDWPARFALILILPVFIGTFISKWESIKGQRTLIQQILMIDLLVLLAPTYAVPIVMLLIWSFMELVPQLKELEGHPSLMLFLLVVSFAFIEGMVQLPGGDMAFSSLDIRVGFVGISHQEIVPYAVALMIIYYAIPIFFLVSLTWSHLTDETTQSWLMWSCMIVGIRIVIIFAGLLYTVGSPEVVANLVTEMSFLAAYFMFGVWGVASRIRLDKLDLMGGPGESSSL